MNLHMSEAEQQINPPRHIAMIMDGNGRWAEKHGQLRVKGHEAGAETVDRMVSLCAEIGVEVLTLYAFSSENWERPALEVAALMRLLQHYLRRETGRLRERNIRLRAIGRLQRLDLPVRRELEKACAETAAGSGMTLNLAISYGGRDELCDAARAVCREVQAGQYACEAIDHQHLAAHLGTAGLPDPDIMIRTGGEFRISNFLLWQLAYAELYFSDTLWPDFSREELLRIIRDFHQRERRFGRVPGR
ncbi:MAG: isoprenyl transferase [Deltaproteobacteria bacterium]|nr:isoprenyl transferase [Deltaproteobacteria bacterium]